MHEIVDRDALAVVGQLGDVLADVVVERDAALLDEQRDRRGGELLRHRAHDERRSRRDRHAVLDVRRPVALLHHDLAVLKHPDGAAGRVRGGVPGIHRVDRADLRAGEGRLRGERSKRNARDECRGSNREGLGDATSDAIHGLSLPKINPTCDSTTVPEFSDISRHRATSRYPSTWRPTNPTVYDSTRQLPHGSGGSGDAAVMIAIFGGTGPTGRLAVDAALLAGHTVTAYVRDPTRLERRTRLTIGPGELRDADGIDRAIAEADAVLSLLGPKPSGEAFAIAEGTSTILAAMGDARGPSPGRGQPCGRRRPRGPPRSRRPCPDPAVVRLSGLRLPRDRADGRADPRLDADWTLVRAVGLTDGPRTGRVVAGPLTGSTAAISRANLADVLVRELTDGALVRQAPVVSVG